MYARTVDRNTAADAMLRYDRSRRWVYDPETGQRQDAGRAPDAGPTSGSPPQPVRAARWVAN